MTLPSGRTRAAAGRGDADGVTPATAPHEPKPIDFEGEIELHVTVDASAIGTPSALEAWAAERGLGCLHVELERGSTPSQPMLTQHARGTLASRLAEATLIQEDLESAGFVVTRVKLEVPATCPDVPRSDEDARRDHAHRYFEHHVRMLVREDDELEAIRRVALAHGAHVSRNARRRRTDGAQERFVTQRCHAAGRTAAERSLEALRTDLAAAHEILEVVSEYVVHDGNLGLDAGWLTAAEGA